MTTVYLPRGDTWRRTWLLRDSSDAPLNLSGASVRLQVRNSNDVVLYSVTDADSALSVDLLQGRIDLLAPYTATQNFPLGEHFFALEVTHANGVRTSYEIGSLVVFEDVTK